MAIRVLKELAWVGAEAEACAVAGAEIEAYAVAKAKTEAEAEAEFEVMADAAVKLVRGLVEATGTAEQAEGPESISTVVVMATEAVAASTEAIRPTTESVVAALSKAAEEQVT